MRLRLSSRLLVSISFCMRSAIVSCCRGRSGCESLMMGQRCEPRSQATSKPAPGGLCSFCWASKWRISRSTSATVWPASWAASMASLARATLLACKPIQNIIPTTAAALGGWWRFLFGYCRFRGHHGLMLCRNWPHAMGAIGLMLCRNWPHAIANWPHALSSDKLFQLCPDDSIVIGHCPKLVSLPLASDERQCDQNGNCSTNGSG